MQHRILTERKGAREFAIVFETGEDPIEGLTAFAEEQGVEGGRLTAIGAFRDCVLAFWNPETKEYEDHAIDEQVECASLVGNVSLTADGSRKVHAHCVVAPRDLTARAGHLRRAHVHPTLEVFLSEAPGGLVREKDAATGLALMQPGAR